MPHPFLHTLDAIAGRIRGRIRKSLLLTMAGLAGAIAAAVAAADAFVRVFGSGGRALALALVLGLPALAGTAGLLLAKKRWSRRQVARALEAGSAQDRELFVTALAVAEEPGPTASTLEGQALHEEFCRLLGTRAAQRSTEIDTRALVGRQRLILPAVAAGCVGVAMLAGAFISRDFRIGLSRVILPWAAISYTPIAERTSPGKLGKDQPPVVELVRPRGPEVAVTLIDDLPCEIRASDDRGLVRMGLAMMVDATKTEQGSVVLARGERAADRALTLALSRLAGLGPDRSVLVWAFAEDTAGQRSVSMPVALDLQALYRAAAAGPGGGGGGGPDPLERLIADQRALATRTFPLTQAPAGQNSAPLADEQQSLLARTRALAERP